MTTIYGTVKNKTRFPSAQVIEERYIMAGDKEFVIGGDQEYVKYRAEYRYDHYKYFTVETAVDLR